MDTKNISYSYNRYVMDYIGYYDLSATLADGTVLASCEVKFNMYDSFHTMDEIYAELDEITAAAADLDNLYIEQNSMGKSTSGYDMPYVIVAKDETVAANWLKLTEEAETDPAAVIEKIQNGTLTDYRVPVLFSNIHANETPCVDASINLLWTLINTAKQGNDATISMNTLTGFTEAGMAEFEKEAAEKSLAIPELIQNLYGDNVMDAYLGWLTEGNTSEDTWGGGYFSGPIDLDEYYTQQEETVVLSDLLDDIFFIIVPEENVEGRTYLTRTSAGGFDLNRDNSFQTQAETQNMTQLIATYNPVTFVELHGYVEAFQCEPCDPPHEPNFEYDLLSNHLMYGGVAFGNGAVANNPSYNSYVIPQRDYLAEQTDGSVFWEEPWDDMSTSYTPQYAMLHGTVSYTVECPAGNEDTTTALMYGELNHARYVAENKESYLLDQLEIFKRGVTNANSNEEVAPYYSDQQDIAGAEADIFRPVYDGEGENGNFYPECYIIPLDGENQTNLAAAYNNGRMAGAQRCKSNLCRKRIYL